MLETRSLPSGAGFTFTLYDPQNLLAPYPAVMPTAEACGQVLNNLISIQHPISVVVTAAPSISGADGNILATGSPDLQDSGTTDGSGNDVKQPAALYWSLGETPPNYEPGLQTSLPGFPPSGDITITLAANAIPGYWIDPTGASRSAPVPAGQTDFMSVFLHEMIHGLGFAYFKINPHTWNIPGQPPINIPGYTDVFTQDTAFGAGGDPSVLYFVGPTAEAHFGGPVPLFSLPLTDPAALSDYSHIGGAPGMPGAGLEDLMNAVAEVGARNNVSDLDLAVLADIGYQIPNYPHLPPAVHYGPVTGSDPGVASLGKVTSVGSPTGTTAITILFTGPMDPTSAADPASYSLNLIGKFVGKHHTYKPGKPLAISYVYYDSNTCTVTLKLARPLSRGQSASLTIHGTSIFDAAGHSIGGDLNEVVRGVVSAKKLGHRH